MELRIILVYLFGGLYGAAMSGGVWGMGRKLCPPMLNVPQPPNRVNSSERLNKLRAEMKKFNVVLGPPPDAYIVTSDDDHQTEYVAERDKRLQYISGFSGHGIAVITMNKSALWTAGLYRIQANEELSCDWLLMAQSSVDPSVADWLKDELPSGGRVAADPFLVANSHWESLAKDLVNSSIILIPLKHNLIDQIWQNKPNYTKHEASIWPIEYSGKTWQRKLSTVRSMMKTEGFDALVITALDEIAWLLNIRGRDIPHLPVLRAYVVLTKDQLHLYTEPNKISEAVKKNLHTEACFSPYCARIHPYEEIIPDLKTFSQLWKKVWLPNESPFSPGVSRAIFTAIPTTKRKSKRSPIVAMKAEKNPLEREGMRKAHVRDGAAMCDFMAYFEQKQRQGEKWDELMVAKTLDQYRREQDLNQGTSFTSIVGFAGHGALPHYEPNNNTKIVVDNSSLLVIDSGGHYMDGTTDVTRTFHFGTPAEEQIDAYTRVLMGSINLALLTFPYNLGVNKVDILARSPLWDAGLDYQHGTGHGIGTFNSVHEGPILISSSKSDGEVFKEGYFFSDEPGFYKEDSYGIRIENILEVVQRNVTYDNSIKYLGFDPVTLFPFEPKLIDYKRLSPQQIRWLNKYNTKVRDEVGYELKKQVRMKGFYWMMAKTEYIPEDGRLRGSASENKIITFLIVQTLVIIYAI